MMRKFLCLLPVLAATACATGPSLESRMAAYIGTPETVLVQKFGVPDKQIEVNGDKYLAYDQHHISITPGFGAFGGWYGGPYFGGPVFDTGIPPQLVERDCETTFLVRANKVVSFTLRGNDCM